MVKKEKYQVKHEWVKNLKLGSDISQFLDSAVDHIGKTLDNAKPNDWIEVIATAGVAYYLYCYGAVTPAMNGLTSLVDAIQNLVKTGSPLLTVDQIGAAPNKIKVRVEDPIRIFRCTAAAYIIVKSAVSDADLASKGASVLLAGIIAGEPEFTYHDPPPALTVEQLKVIINKPFISFKEFTDIQFGS
jgi:hypothetical protein